MQMAFAAALRDPSAPCPVRPAGNLSIYRNNSTHSFRAALESTFPVIRKRVGDGYFRQLCMQYRARFPSRSGDLHWTGRDFSAFLLERLHGGDYAWLADLARLEWSREQASITRIESALTAEVLANFGPAQLEHLVFSLQPSLSLLASDFPVFTIWQANQVDNAPPADQSMGGQCGMVRVRIDGLEVRQLEPGPFSFLFALRAGAPLGEAISSAGLDQEGVVSALGFVFAEGLVCALKDGRNEKRES